MNKYAGLKTHYFFPKKRFLSLCLLLLLSWPSASVLAVDFYLIAKPTTLEIDDGFGGTIPIPMWGFALDKAGRCYHTTPRSARLTSAHCTNPVATVPGPRLDTGTSSEMTIFLTNLLPRTPASIVISGQEMPYSNSNNGPTWVNGSVGPTAGGNPGTRRVRSLGREAAHHGGQSVYRWKEEHGTAIRAGSFIYHSGTHQQVQVQMGLYGAITRDTSAGQIYPGVSYDNEVLLFYGELDLHYHFAIADGNYGSGKYTSAIGYRPLLYLVNGKLFYRRESATIEGPVVRKKTLLRFFNMGLKSHSPVLQNLRMNVVAEDGYPYRYPRDQYSIALPAGKSKDAILTPKRSGTFAVYDGLLGLSNGGPETGGLLGFLKVAASRSVASSLAGADLVLDGKNIGDDSE